jgi:amino acid adenylation domain-containing protein
MSRQSGKAPRFGCTTAEAEDARPLTPNQQALWWLRTYAPESPAYNPGWAVRLRGPLDPAVLQRCLDALVRRHPVVGLLIESRSDGTAHQRVGAGRATVELVEAAGWDEAQIAEALRTANAEPYDLERQPPLRVRLFRLGAEEAVLLVGMHHIAMDGRSTAVLMEELGALLAAGGDAGAAGLDAPETHFLDHAAEEARYLSGAAAEDDWAFWAERLRGPLPTLDLRFADRRRPRSRAYRGCSVPCRLDARTTERLRAYAAEALTTPYTVLMAAWQTLLHRASGQEELLVGSPTFGARDSASRQAVGYFTNMLPLRAALHAELPFAELVARTKAEVAAALPHARFPFSVTVERLGGLKDPAVTPVFQAVFAYQQTLPDELARGLIDTVAARELDWGGLSATPVVVPDQGAGQFDLALDLCDLGEVVAGEIKADAELFERETVASLAEAFVCLLRAALAAPDTALAELALTAPAARDAHLAAANCPAPRMPERPCLHRAFSAQAAARPEALALGGPEPMTYGALEAAANRLAHRLRQAGVRTGDLVGLCADRGPLQIVGLLGILKAGGAYVPLDPDYPAERLSLIVRDAELSLVVAPEAQAARLELPAARLVASDAADLAEMPETAPVDESAPGDPAYVIYTSGSTGTPKGVPVSHRNVLRLFAAAERDFDFGPDDVWSLFHSLAFDFSVWELWGAFLYGGTLVPVDAMQVRDPEALLDLLDASGVTVLNQTPSAFYRLATAEAGGPPRPGRLRYVIFGGEALEPARLAGWAARHGLEAPALVNMYGITETTVHVTVKRLGETDIAAGQSPVGRPLADLEVHLLDRAGRPVPQGMPGEICVGGEGVAGGYLNRPELTAERFVPHPVTEGARLYRSGDLARRRADGELVFLGRTDAQVKLRGFRIEPGEIEAALQAMPDVADTAVAVKPQVAADGAEQEACLVAYLVPRGGAVPDTGALRDDLTRRLPPHMVPSHFLTLEALPRTPSGKLDRDALPAPAAPTAVTAGKELPQTPAERAVCEAYAEALGLARVGRDAAYFALGGDSIRSIRVIAGLRARGYELPLEALFRLQTAEAVAQVLVALAPGEGASDTPVARAPFEGLSAADRAKLPRDHPGGLEDAYPATALQAGMIFHGLSERERGTFHDVFAYRLDAPLDPAALERAVAGLVAAHEVLRTSFDTSTYSTTLQLVAAAVPTPLTCAETPSDGPLSELVARHRDERFDIARAPLIRFHAMPAPQDRFRLVVVFHHAILDGWSVASMMTELLERYAAQLSGEPAEPPRPPRFADYVLGHELPARGDEAARAHWLERLGDRDGSFLPKPLAPQTPEMPAAGQRELRRDLPVELSGALHALAERLEVPVSSLLLTAYLRVLGPLCGERRVVAGLTRHGRPEVAGSERTLGLFLNMPPVVLDLHAAESWAELCRLNHAGERSDMPHRRYPLSELLRLLGQRRLFEAAFNFVDYHVYDRLAQSGGVRILERDFFEQTDLAVLLHGVRNGRDLSLVLNHDAAALAPELAERLMQSVLRALAAMTTDPDAPHASFGLMTEEEAAEMPPHWTGTAVDYPREATLDALFDAVAAERPDAEALCTPAGESVTYADLAARANRLAQALRRYGAEPGARVAVALPRGLDQLAVSLAILKAGGAFVPVDPELPEARQRFMLQDCGAVVVVAAPGAAGHLGGLTPAVGVAELEAAARELPATPPAAGPRDGRSLAYVIYTSGTTGRPKGVACTHRGIVRLVRSGGPFQFAPGDRMAHANAVLFDVCLLEIWGTLLNGGGLLVLPPGPPVLATLPQVLADARINVLALPTGLFHLVVDECPEALARMDKVIMGGEALSPEHAGRALAAMGDGAELWNGYGPTENAVFTTMHRVTADDAAAASVPIGLPVPNTTVHLLDGFDRPVPPGVPGELMTGGDGVALGYLERPELNAARFPANPFPVPAGLDGSRLYRTGDLACRRADGTLLFLGRRDHQIKLRGFRIELEEIAQTLRAVPGVADGLVVLDEGRHGRRLLAYVVPEPGAEADWPTVRAALAARLPDYMVPESGLVLPALPLSPVGKVDRTALPRPEEYQAEAAVRPPRSETERVVHAVWTEVLGHGEFGVLDDFFALGGDSLYATQVASRLARRLEMEVPVGMVIRARTAAELARQLDEATLASAAPDALADILAELNLTELDTEIGAE